MIWILATAFAAPDGLSAAPVVLTSAVQIHALPPAEAARAFPVRLRSVGEESRARIRPEL